MAKWLLICLSFTITSTVLAQTLQEQSENLDWRIIPGQSSKNAMSELFGLTEPMRRSNGDFELSRCFVSPNETAVLVNYSGSAYGVLLLTDKLKVKWNIPVAGIPLAIGKWHDKIIVIATPEVKFMGWKNQLDALLIEPGNGKVVIRKNLYKGSEDLYQEPKFFFIPKNNDFKLGIRTTASRKSIKVSFMGSGMKRFRSDYGQTSGFELISFDDKLEVASRIQVPVKKDLEFLDCRNNSDGGLFFAYYEGEENIGLQRINPEGDNSTDYRHVSFDAKNNTGFDAGFLLSQSQPNVAYVNIEYTNSEKDKALGTYRIDFDQQGNQSVTTVINKEYKRGLKDSYVPYNKEEGKPETDGWKDLRTAAVLDNGDKVIIIKESRLIELVQGGGEIWTTGDAIVSIYDRQMKLQSQLIIPKEMKINTSIGNSSSFHIQDNILYMISGKSRVLNFHAIYAAIDLATGKLLKYALPDKGSIKNSHPIDPLSTLWFKDGFIINYLDGSGFMKITKITTYPQKFSY